VDIELTNHNNVQYSAPLSVGGQALPVIYDTGSFEIIVLSKLCAICARQHVVYDSTQSSTFVSSGGVTAEHLFGSGPVKSEKAYDTVQLVGRGNAVAAYKSPFWQVVSHDIAVWDENAKFSGIVGLGHLDYIPEGYGAPNSHDRTLLSNVGVNLFAICLGRSGHRPSGVLSLWKGPATVPSHFREMRVAGNVHWSVHMTGVKFAGVNWRDPCHPSCGAIIDSGTSLIAAPPSADGLIALISSRIRRDCSNLHELPVLELQLDGLMIKLPPKAYVMRVTTAGSNSSNILSRIFGGSNHEQECSPGFMSIDKNSQLGPVWVLGMPFLRYYHTIFDRQAKKIHVATSSSDCSLAGSGMAFHNSSSSGAMIPNIAGLHNSTAAAGPLGAAGASSPPGVFDASDFEPNEVDMSAIREPTWASMSPVTEKWLDF